MHVVVVALWALVGACAVAVVYPYTLYPLILRAFAPRPPAVGGSNSSDGSEFALLFCAYNEAKAMPDKIANLAELRAVYPELKILAYDDLSSDGTANMLESAGLDIQVVRGTGRTGKAHGMKLLASMADRELLVFTDANVELSPSALHQLHRTFVDPDVGGVCGVLKYIDVEGTPTAHAGGLYWRLEELVKTLESKSGNVMGADGSIFAIRRNLYPEFPDTVLDDMTVSMSVVFQEKRLIKDPLVIAFERLVASRADDNRRRIRIAMRCFHTHIWMRPQLRAMSTQDRWRWWSHRYIRWLGAYFLVIGCVSGLAALLLAGHGIAALALTAATLIVGCAGLYFRLGPVSTIIHLLSSILMTGVGVSRAQRGDTMATWKPPSR